MTRVVEIADRAEFEKLIGLGTHVYSEEEMVATVVGAGAQRVDFVYTGDDA